MTARSTYIVTAGHCRDVLELQEKTINLETVLCGAAWSPSANVWTVAIVANKAIGMANKANELDKLVVAEGRDELNKLAVAKGQA